MKLDCIGKETLQLNKIYGKYVSFLSAFYSTTQEGNGEGMNGREMTEEDERRIKFQAEVQFSCDCYHSYWVIAIMDQQKVEDIQRCLLYTSPSPRDA